MEAKESKLLKILGAIAFLVYLVFFVPFAQAQQPIARVDKFVGEVFIRSQVTAPRGEWRRVTAAPEQLFSGDEVRAERGRAEIIYPNDDAIRLLENSVVSLTANEVTRRRLLFGTKSVMLRNIAITFGRLWANVTVDEKNEVEFRSPVAVASVRGTILELIYNAATRVWFLGAAQGRVAVTAQRVTNVAGPGQAITVAQGQPPSRPFAWTPGAPPAITEAAMREALAAPPPAPEAMAPSLAPGAPTELPPPPAIPGGAGGGGGAATPSQ